MSYEPRGKVALLVDAMRAAQDKPVWPSTDVAACMGIAQGNVHGYLSAAVINKAMHRKLENGRTWYSLQPFPEAVPVWQPPKMTPPRGEQAGPARSPLPAPIASVPPPIMVKRASEPPTPEPDLEPAHVEDADGDEEEPPQEFNAAMWLDGDLDLYGLIALEDGGYRITSENVMKLRKRLAWGPV